MSSSHLMLDTCFGRKSYIELLLKRISGLKDGYRQNVALLGDELVGKTAILRRCIDSFCDSRFLIVYLEPRQETIDSFCRRFIAILLYNFLLPGLPNVREDLDFLVEKSASYIPRTVEKIRALLANKKKRKEDAFSALLSLPEQLHAESGKFCVVIFDEFHNLDRLGVKKIYREWAQLLLVQKRTMYILASSAVYKARSILAKDLSLLFGNFEIVQVEPLDVKASEAFLRQRLDRDDPGTPARKFLTHLAAGNPYYLSVIADALARRPGDPPQILEDLLFQTEGVLSQRFDAKIKRYEETAGGQETVAILCHLSAGCNKVKDICHLMHRLNREIAPRINQLIETDAVRRSGDFLIISDRLFGFWLRFVYRERLSSLTHDLSNQRIFFRDRIDSMLQEFVQQSSKPVSVRLAELFRLFSDERIQLERRHLRLDRFREVKPMEFSCGRLKEGLICRSSDSIWVLAVSSGSLTEDDIADFSRECKKYRNKLLRKIIVNFSDLDHSSHLKALEEKIITWDLNRVNQILDLYSKPRIIA